MHVSMLRNFGRAKITTTALALCGCSTVADWGPPTGLAIPSEDIVAVGRLENLGNEPADYDPDDLLGHGWFFGNFHVSHVESGELPQMVVPVRYYGHSFLREDKKFRFRLRPIEGGRYVICKRPGSAGFICDQKGS